jgi:two-component system chemotaxis response regulator CheB
VYLSEELKLTKQAGNQAGLDEASSVVWGMPGFVARAGLGEKILPLDQISGEIIRRVAAQPSLQHTH